MGPLHPDNIGGGRVERTFTFGGRRLNRGDTLTREEIIGMPASNRNALIETKHLMVWPPHVMVDAGELHVINLGFGRYDVIRGTKVNEAPLDREAAYQMAGKPTPEDKANGH
jgi:hypothetical protein